MTRLLLKFSENHINQPITSQVILEQKVPLTILRAHVEPTYGEILAEVPQEREKQIIKAFKEKGVTVFVVEAFVRRIFADFPFGQAAQVRALRS
jgi:ABC-type methionine transport system ATPase subunit